MLIWAHIEHSFRETFPTRMSEWFLAVMMLNWAIVLTLDPNVFEAGQSFKALAGMMLQENWALVCFVLGSARLVILAINGAWRRTAHMRALGSLVSALFWFEVTIGFLQGGVVTTGLAIYPMLFLMDSVNAVRALGDAGRSDATHKVTENGTDG